MEVEKSAWRRPELTVLVRSRPEEAVLAACKLGGAQAGPFVNHSSCKSATSCNACSAKTGS